MEKFGLSVKRKGYGLDTNEHKHSIPNLIKSVIEQADIILEILDARFIEKTRNYSIEERVKELGKILVYILNKADLIDVNLTMKNIELEQLKPYVFFSCKDRKKSSILRNMIKIQAKKLDKEAVSVGVVGYPNTGKSSIINLLIGKSVARTSTEAGFTKGLQKIKLSSGLYLIDTPGIIPLDENSTTVRKDLIKHSEIGVRTWDKMKEPEMVVNSLVMKNPGVFENYYKINAQGDSGVLIEELGRKIHCLKKGNLVDSDRVARKILRDWQEGKIRV